MSKTLQIQTIRQYKYGTKSINSRRAKNEIKTYSLSFSEVEKIFQKAEARLDPREKLFKAKFGSLPGATKS